MFLHDFIESQANAEPANSEKNMSAKEEIEESFSDASHNRVTAKQQSRTGEVVEKLIFSAPECSYVPNIRFKIITTEVYNNPLTYVFIPGKIKQKRYTILYSHGNAEDMGDIESWLECLAEFANVNVIGYDYYGYGLSVRPEYKPTISYDTVCDDIYSLWNHVSTVHNLEPSNVILYGRSIGSAPALYLASRYSFAGLILESAFTSVLDVVAVQVGFVPTSVVKVVASATRLNQLPAMIDNTQNASFSKVSNTLMLHGDKDELIPFKHSQILAARLHADLKKIEGGTHNNLASDFLEKLIVEIITFLELVDSVQRAGGR